MINRLTSLFRSRYGWSFTASPLKRNRHALTEGEEIIFSGEVRNNGLRLGTAYVRLLVANCYHLDAPLFDSNRDLPRNARQALRLVDIPINRSRSFACGWKIPSGLSNVHLDVRLEVWNPHLLFGGPKPYRFYDTGWLGGFEVVEKSVNPNQPSLFISYSWDSDEHRQWVRSFSEELRKHNIDSVLDQRDMFAGDETTLFMERGVRHSKIKLLICSENYTRKANNREAGAGYETIISSHEYMLCPVEERAMFIPIVRNNNLPKGRKLPTYLGSALYIDMSSDNWRAEPMLDLLASINRHAL